MERKYDKKIKEHYRVVAKEQKFSSVSTMADNITRDMETNAILQFVGECLRVHRVRRLSKRVTIMDIGCGNGYTLDVLSKEYPQARYFGIEKSDELMSMALSRFQGRENIEILKGDIRDKHFAKNIAIDILICQRVIINLLNRTDQRRALNNIINSVNSPKPWGMGGVLLFLESFKTPLEKINDARAEFNLPSIQKPHHNLYLDDDFFKTPLLKPLETVRLNILPNFLSTHYYVARVLHPIFTQNKPFKRNSEFVKFFSSALNMNAGDYSPLKLYMFEKTNDTRKRLQRKD